MENKYKAYLITQDDIKYEGKQLTQEQKDEIIMDINRGISNFNFAQLSNMNERKCDE
jgi:hypothetical protein